jgi:hypothetical protein
VDVANLAYVLANRHECEAYEQAAAGSCMTAGTNTNTTTETLQLDADLHAELSMDTQVRASSLLLLLVCRFSRVALVRRA